MKCRITRKELRKERERMKLKEKFLLEFIDLNSNRIVQVNENKIYVDTVELWNLKIPENWKIEIGKNEEEIKSWGFLSVENNSIRFYIYGS